MANSIKPSKRYYPTLVLRTHEAYKSSPICLLTLSYFIIVNDNGIYIYIYIRVCIRNRQLYFERPLFDLEEKRYNVCGKNKK